MTNRNEFLRGTNESNRKKKKRKGCLLVGKAANEEKKLQWDAVPEVDTADKYICPGCEGSLQETCRDKTLI